MELKKSEVINFIKRIYPNARIKEINKGYSSYVFEIKTKEKEIVLKACEKRSDLFSLKKEKKAYELMKKQQIPIPKIISYGQTKGKKGFEYLVMEKIEGEILGEIFDRINKEEQISLMEELGKILGKIHAKKFDKYGTLDSKGIYAPKEYSIKKVGKRIVRDPAIMYLLPNSLYDLGEALTYKKIDPKIAEKLSYYIIQNQDLIKSLDKPSLIHGDFHLKHVFVKKISQKWIIVAIIDFEHSASNLREYDFIKLHREGLFKKPEYLKSFMKGYKKYQSIPDNFEKKVRYLRITRDCGFLSILLKAGNLKKFKEVLNNLKKEIKN